MAGTKELIINASLPEKRIALIEDGEIQELVMDRPSDRGVVGNIYKGKVTRVLPGMQAAFVDIGLDKAAFLYVDDVYLDAGEKKVDFDGNSDSEMELELEGVDPQEDTEDYGDDLDDGEESLALSADSDEDELDAHVDDSDTDVDTSAQMSSDQEEFSASEEADAESDSDNESLESDSDDDQDPSVSMAAKKEDKKTVSKKAGSKKKEKEEKQAELEVDSQEDEVEALEVSEEPSSEIAEAKVVTDELQAGESSSAPRQQMRKVSLTEDMKKEVEDTGDLESDRWQLSENEAIPANNPVNTQGLRPSIEEEAAKDKQPMPSTLAKRESQSNQRNNRQEFRQKRGRDRKIRSKPSMRPYRPQAKIEDLLKEGQEVLVQIAKDPIATKGARLTCHISLPGRHLVCMPTIDHIGVSRRIDRDDDRRRLRDLVRKNRKGSLGFIVRTASGGSETEQWIQQDIEYLSRFWEDIRKKAETAKAPAIVYQDLDSVLKAIRDWVTDDVKKIIVDSRFYHAEIQDFVTRFMPHIKDQVELYHGDIPIFDAYGISTALHRALERRVWLKSGGYIVIDQAEALVAIDVNTGRYVGAKNLEDTIFKTNLEAVEEIAYQLRLRNCGGIIIIDLIDMEREDNRRKVIRSLENALRKDRARPTIVRMSELGLIEMTRKRTRDTIVRALCQTCTYCEGKGYIKNKETITYEILREIERVSLERDIRRILVQAHSDIINILAFDHRDTLDQMEKRFKKQIFLQAVGDFHIEQFEVTTEKHSRSFMNANNPRSRGGSDRSRNNRNTGGSSSAHHRKSSIPKPRDTSSDVNQGYSAQSSESHSQRDRENIGNAVEPQRTSTIPVPRSDDDIGNRVQPANEKQSINGAAPQKGSADFEDEEDRLAYLRAQAAQDAALAAPKGDSASPSTGNFRNRNNQNRPPGRRNNNRGGRNSGWGSKGGGGRGRSGSGSGRGRVSSQRGPKRGSGGGSSDIPS